MSHSAATWSPSYRRHKYSWCTGLEDSYSDVVCWMERRGGHWYRCKLQPKREGTFRIEIHREEIRRSQEAIARLLCFLINYLTQLNKKNFKQKFSWNWNTNESIEQEIFIILYKVFHLIERHSLIHCYVEEISNRKLKYVYHNCKTFLVTWLTIPAFYDLCAVEQDTQMSVFEEHMYSRMQRTLHRYRAVDPATTAFYKCLRYRDWSHDFRTYVDDPSRL